MATFPKQLKEWEVRLLLILLNFQMVENGRKCACLGMLKKPMIGVESGKNKYLDMSYPF